MEKNIIIKKISCFLIFAAILIMMTGSFVWADVNSNTTSNSTENTTVDPKAWKKINGVCYNGSGVAIPNAITRGIDVSSWQGDIDWKKVKADNVDFAFIRVSYGTSLLDTKYAQNMKNANEADFPVGVYLFSTALTEEEALKEAQFTIKKLQGYKVSYPVVIDLEYSEMSSLTKAQVGKIALAFCNEIKKAGYYPMVYCNSGWYKKEIDWSYLKGIDIWIAEYGDTIMPPSTSSYQYTIWQSTSGMGELNSTKGLINGISKYDFVDVNFGFADYTKIITPRINAYTNYKESAKADLTIDLKVTEVTPTPTPTSTPTPTPVPRNGWRTWNNKTYYYVNNVKVTGWKEINGSHYYFHKTKGYLYRDKLLTSKKNNVCYVAKNGKRVSNKWVTWENKRYYMGANGFAVKNFQTIKGKVYYFNKTHGYLYKNKKLTAKSSGNVYYATSNGSLYTDGFLTIKENGKKNTYYFNKNGKAQKGWKKINKKWYYFTSVKGVMRKSCTMTSSKGKVYVFDSKGVCISGKK